MERFQLQEVSAGRLLGQFVRGQWTRLARWIAAAVPYGLLLIGAGPVLADCGQEAVAQRLVFKPVKYNDSAGIQVLQQLALDATVSCVVTGRSAPHGAETQITIFDKEDKYGYIDTAVSPHDSAMLYWPKHADLIAQYDAAASRLQLGASCVLLGPLTILPSQIVRLTLEALPGRDVSAFRFQGEKAQYVNTEENDCNADPAGPHPAGPPVEFKINPQMGGCIVLRRGETHPVAWIPIKALLSSPLLPMENYFTSDCNARQDGQPNTIAVRSAGYESRDQNESKHLLDDLKGAVLHVELVPAPAPNH
jgi:hypothetical protein